METGEAHAPATAGRRSALGCLGDNCWGDGLCHPCGQTHTGTHAHRPVHERFTGGHPMAGNSVNRVGAGCAKQAGPKLPTRLGTPRSGR